jgi:hypothetical protein
MNASSPAQFPARHRTWPGRLVQVATVLIVAGVAAATFVFSYPGVHVLALQSGVSAKLARFYPAIFDAVLVIACAAAPLRTRWRTRLYTWIVIILVIGLLGAIDAVHAMDVAIPRRQAAGVAAVLPWVLLLLAFGLWLAILAHFRAQRQDADAPPAASERPDDATTSAEIMYVGAAAADGTAAGNTAAGDTAPDDWPAGDSAPDEITLVDATLDEILNGTPAPPVPEIPGVPYATGPRLRRVRSLPAPPVDDGGEGGD